MGNCQIRSELVHINYFNYGGSPTSKTSAHHNSDTVATFRSWRGFQITIAKPPAGPPLQEESIEIFLHLASAYFNFKQVIHSFEYLFAKSNLYSLNEYVSPISITSHP